MITSLLISQCCESDITADWKCAECGTQARMTDGIPTFLDTEILSKIDSADTAWTNGSLCNTDTAAANAILHNSLGTDYENIPCSQDMFDPTGPAQARIRHALTRLAEVAGSELIIDFGCGTGNILKAGSERFGAHLGLDVSVGVARIARGRGFNVVLASVTRTPLKSEVANCVTGFSVLHHFADPTPVIAEAFRVLRPGGYLYTDWDPNRLAKGRRDVCSSWLWHNLTSLRRFLQFGKTHTDKPVPRGIPPSLWDISEYQLEKHGGLDPLFIRDTCLRVGYSHVVILPHNNTASMDDVYQPTWKDALRSILNGGGHWQSPLHQAPIFSIVAKK